MYVYFYDAVVYVNAQVQKHLIPKGRCNYGVDTVITKNQATQKFYIHFFIDNSNAKISLYTLSCSNF